MTGITRALSRSACDAVFDAVERARSYRATVCFDVNYRLKLWDPAQAVPVLRALAAQADILLAGVNEARLVLGGLEDAPAGELARAGESGDKLYCTRHRADRPAKVPGDERDDLICKDAGQFGMAEQFGESGPERCCPDVASRRLSAGASWAPCRANSAAYAWSHRP